MTNVADIMRSYQCRGADKRMRTVYSHTSLVGGSYQIPNTQDAEQELFFAMSKDLKNGDPYFLNEIASEVFKMFFDFDFMVPSRLTTDQVAEIVSHVHEVVAKFYPSDIVSRIPHFFEQIVLHSDAPKLCERRSDVEELTRKKSAFNDGVHIFVDELGSVSSDTVASTTVVWITQQPPSGMYSVSATGDIVSTSTVPPHVFQNPTSFQEELTCILCSDTAPDGALKVEEEVEKNGPTNYESSTTFVVEDGRYFTNAKRDSKGCVKHGIHVIMPEVTVNIQHALFFRESLVAHLSSVYGVTNDIFAPDGWTDVVDNAVYGTGRGLRMYGSCKAEQCRNCPSRTSRTPCGVFGCVGGKVNVGRPHLLFGVYVDGRENVELTHKYSKNTMLVISRTSIRTARNVAPGWKRYDGCPNYGNALKTTTTTSGSTVHDVKQRRASFPSNVRPRLSNLNDVTDRTIWNIFEKHIRSRFVQQWRNLRVVGVKQSSDRLIYLVNVAGDGQHWCLNKMNASSRVTGADHTSNTIYFQCTPNGLCQRCHSPKNSTDNRSTNTLCSKFCCGLKQLHASENQLLFPPSVQKYNFSSKSSKSTNKRKVET